MDLKCTDYSAPKTTVQRVNPEGSICLSSNVKSVKAKVEVDEWVTVENDITFE